MLVIGAKGHAKEILQVLVEDGKEVDLFFFDNVSADKDRSLYNVYKIVTSFNEAELILQKDRRFILGIGNPRNRFQLSNKFILLGGELTSVISKTAQIGNFGVNLGEGLNIMKNAFVSNDVRIGDGCLLNLDCSIHHDVTIGKFSELCPKSQILGGAVIDDYCFIGAGAIVLPHVKLGKNVMVGAGAVVTKDFPDNSLVAGVPARKIRENPPFCQ